MTENSLPLKSSPAPTLVSCSDTESTDSMDFPHDYMMNPENTPPEEDVEDPIIEETLEPATKQQNLVKCFLRKQFTLKQTEHKYPLDMRSTRHGNV